MNPKQLKKTLSCLAEADESSSVMIWGPPGVGKSSIVTQVAEQHEMQLTDVRLSQLAPTDLRGLPVAENGIARWFPPEFLPQNGRGILFLDELNMAAPAVQGVAQQLVLDRKVGSYTVPDGWLIWSAGNRREDRASVFEMPAPLANRFLHFELEANLANFREYALRQNINEQILAFLAFRPELLHKLDPQQPAWPSPRTWEMANRLLELGLPIGSAVGEGAQVEFETFIKVYANLPDTESILSGKGGRFPLPKNPGSRYALTTGLARRVQNPENAVNAAAWLFKKASTEWGQLFLKDCLPLLRAKGQFAKFSSLVIKHAEIRRYLKDFRDLLETD